MFEKNLLGISNFENYKIKAPLCTVQYVTVYSWYFVGFSADGMVRKKGMVQFHWFSVVGLIYIKV